MEPLFLWKDICVCAIICPMNKIRKILFNVLIIMFTLTSAFAFDYRQFLFGNNYKNIIQIEDKAKVDAAVKTVMPYLPREFDTLDWEYESWLFEEKYDNATVYRIIAIRSFDKFGKRISDSTPKTIADWKVLFPDELRQIVFIKTADAPVILFADAIFYRIMADGTVRSSVGNIIRGLEVITRDNEIVLFCSHATVNRITYYVAMDEEDDVKPTEYERYSKAYFKRYSSALLNAKGFIDVEMHYDFSLSAPMALIDDERPFRYTIQNMFDNNPGTCFVEKPEDSVEKGYQFMGLKNADVKKIKIINGLSYDKKTYSENNRIKTISSKENTQDITFKDNVTESQVAPWNEMDFYVSSIYKGSKYDDTCISELDLFIDEDGKGKKLYWLFEHGE